MRAGVIAIRADRAAVVEGDDAVAQQEPALLGVGGDDLGRHPVASAGGRALRIVRAGVASYPR